MSMLYAFKPLKDRVLRSPALCMKAAGLTPNMVTAAGMLACAGAGLLAAYGLKYESIALFLFGACLDAIDGSFARACDMSSEFGRYFDSFADRASELIFVAGAVIGGAPVSALFIIAGSCILLLTRVYNHRKGLDSNAAMFGRPERLAFLIIGLISPGPYSTLLFTTAGFLCVASSIQALALSQAVDHCQAQ